MKKMKRIIALALMALSLMAVALPAMADVTGINMAKSGGLKVHQNPNGTGNIIGYHGNGATVTIMSTSGSWWHTKHSNGNGYSSADYLVIPGDYVKINTSNVNLRPNANTNGNPLSYKPSNGEQFTVLQVTTQWIQVQNSSAIGWVNWQYLTKSGSSTPTVSWPPPYGTAYCSDRNHLTTTKVHVHVGSNTACQYTITTHRTGFYGSNNASTHEGEITHSNPACSASNVSDCNLQYKSPDR